jgi:hypothetical protein
MGFKVGTLPTIKDGSILKSGFKPPFPIDGCIS